MKKNKAKAFGMFVTDIHLTKDNGALVKSIFNQMIKICKERGIDKIFCGGDVFTNRSGQPLSCLTDFKEILKNLRSSKIHLHCIAGNHDKTDPDDDKSYLDVFDGDMTVMKLYREGTCRIFDYEMVVALIPYYTDEKWLEEFNKVDETINAMLIEQDIDPNAVKILITHSGFDGVANNDGSKVESVIKPKMFADWTKVLVGHYHNASKLAKNVIYTGSAYQNNFGETADDKGCTIINWDGTLEHVQLDFPHYIKEKVDINDTERIRELTERYKGNTNDHVRFIFSGKKSDADKVNAAEFSKLGIDVKFQAEETEEAMELSEQENVMCYDKKSVTKDFMKFCSENNIKGKQLKYGMNLIKNM